MRDSLAKAWNDEMLTTTPHCSRSWGKANLAHRKGPRRFVSTRHRIRRRCTPPLACSTRCRGCCKACRSGRTVALPEGQPFELSRPSAHWLRAGPPRRRRSRNAPIGQRAIGLRFPAHSHLCRGVTRRRPAPPLVQSLGGDNPAAMEPALPRPQGLVLDIEATLVKSGPDVRASIPQLQVVGDLDSIPEVDVWIAH